MFSATSSRECRLTVPLDEANQDECGGSERRRVAFVRMFQNAPAKNRLAPARRVRSAVTLKRQPERQQFRDDHFLRAKCRDTFLSPLQLTD